MKVVEFKAEILRLQTEIDKLLSELEVFRKWVKLNDNGHPVECGCLKCKGY